MRKSYRIVQYLGAGSAPSVLFLKALLKDHVIVGDDFMPAYLRIVKPLAWIVALFDFMTVRLTDVIITYPAFWNTFLRKCVRSKKVLHIPHGVFCTMPKTKLEKETLARMVFVGSPAFDQNLIAIRNIIKIAKSLMKRGINFHVEIVGGPLESAEKLLDEEVVQKGLVTFRGFVSEEVLRNIYFNSFLGLLPFFESTKSFSQKIKPLEYFAHGLLVVSGSQGIVGIDGLANGREYLEAKDVEEMTEIIAKCLKSPDYYFDITLKGIEVAKRYSWQSVLKPYIDLIEKTGVHARVEEKL
jgi:glycosyltransferase involved in cell wall biosynthesis